MAAVCKLETPAKAARRHPVPWAIAVVWACLFAAAVAPSVACSAQQNESATLPELVRTRQRVFSIPFRPPPAKSADSTPQRIVLSVSTDLGVTWAAAGEAAPDAGAFTYRAEADGEYWFQLRAIDAKGRTRGGAGPDIRVLVDAAGPKIAARVWRGADGEIVCRYAAVDDSLRLDSLSVEYRGATDPGWKKITAEGVLSREAPAHLVGEEIWWAGEQVDALIVKIAISDSAGNNTVRRFTLEPSDPQVDQAALARELGAPPLPSQESVAEGGSLRRAAPVSSFGMPETARSRPASASTLPSAAGGWSAEPAAPWAAEAPRAAGAVGPAAAAAATSVVARPTSTGPGPAQTLGPPPGGPRPTEYRGRPLQLVRSRRFAWDYEFKADHADTGPVRVELWSTHDGGISWQRAAVDDDATSPIQVTLPAAGLYGFRLDILPDLPDNSSGPQPGEQPDCWLGVDDEPPTVELIEVARVKPGEPIGMVIRYAAHDQMLEPRSVRLAWAPRAEGPWTTIADGLDAQGEHRWQPSRTTPAKVHIRVEAADVAGNVGFTTSPGPVPVTTPRVVGKLGGVTTLPASP